MNRSKGKTKTTKLQTSVQERGRGTPGAVLAFPLLCFLANVSRGDLRHPDVYLQSNCIAHLKLDGN